jgi:hypothetical protein
MALVVQDPGAFGSSNQRQDASGVGLKGLASRNPHASVLRKSGLSYWTLGLVTHCFAARHGRVTVFG